jgi:hypothetical protein
MVWIQTNFTAESMNTGQAKKSAVAEVKPVVAKKKATKVEPVATPVVEEAVAVAVEPEVAEPEAE